MLKPILEAALLGDYKQTTGRYFWNGCYCASGAIATEAIKQGAVEGSIASDGHPRAPSGYYLHELFAELGIGADLLQAIAQRNDSGATFAEIYKFLEEVGVAR